MRKITGETTAWLPSGGGPEDLNQTDDKVVDSLYYSNYDMKNAGWTKVGKATVTVEIPDKKALVESKVASLHAEITKTRAEAQNTITALETKIQKLLALEFSA